MNFRYGWHNTIYTKILNRCIGYITDNDGNISLDRMVTNSKKMIVISWVMFVASILIMGIGMACMIGSFFLEQLIMLGVIIFVIFICVGTFMLPVALILLQIGYAFRVTSKCLKDNIEIIKCPFCGNNLDYDDKFCGKCGAKFNFETTCTNCGTKNMHDARFCKKCGNSLIKNMNSQGNDNHTQNDKIWNSSDDNDISETINDNILKTDNREKVAEGSTKTANNVEVSEKLTNNEGVQNE